MCVQFSLVKNNFLCLNRILKFKLISAEKRTMYNFFLARIFYEFYTEKTAFFLLSKSTFRNLDNI